MSSLEKISIICVTYNHAHYIKECLNNILNQETSFGLEILVYDDGSTDQTIDIINTYIKKYPNIITGFQANNNNEKRQGFGDIQKAFQPKGKYIAICDGDDYWTDKKKLQTQINFLEKNKDYSFCCHRYKTLTNGVLGKDIAHDFHKNGDVEITKQLYFTTWLTQPSTVLYRAKFWNELAQYSDFFRYFRDIHIFYFLLNKGKGKSINKFMSIYRVHDKGIANGKTKLKNLAINKKIWEELLQQHPTDKLLIKRHLKTIFILMKYGNIKEKLSYYKENTPLAIKSSFKDFLKIHYYVFMSN